MEDARLQAAHRFEAGVRQQAIQSVRRHGLADDIRIQGKTIAQLVQQSPFECAQQRLQRTAGGQQRQGRTVVLEEFGVRVFGRQQPDQQFVQVEAAEQGVGRQQVGNPGGFQASDRLQLTLPAKLGFQRDERSCQRPIPPPRTAQDGTQAAFRGEEIHQRTGFLVGTAVQDECGAGNGDQAHAPGRVEQFLARHRAGGPLRRDQRSP
ncbi:hypothetical protein D3C76_910110 [compost metagenome]